MNVDDYLCELEQCCYLSNGLKLILVQESYAVEANNTSSVNCTCCISSGTSTGRATLEATICEN